MEIYGRVRRAVLVEGRSERAVAQEFGIAREIVRKMLLYLVPPGYRRERPVKRPKLGRDVAIKVLPEAFAHGLARLHRFQRKAKTLASLNHLNIAAINSFEEDAGSNYLVMELVPGKTLKDGAEVNPDIGSTEMKFRAWPPHRRHGSERGVR